MNKRSNPLRVGLTAACMALTGMAMAPQADAADRMVVYENFTATWCQYCPDVGTALTWLLNDYPAEVISLQCHVSDNYTTSWGNIRANKYGVGGIPHTVCDGTLQRVGGGSPTAIYNQFNTWRNSRMATATDVSIDVQVTPVSGQTYLVTATVGVEPGGATKTMDVHIVDTLYEQPNAIDERYNYCVMQGFNRGSHTLSAGEDVVFEQQVTFNATSWDRPEDIRIVVFAQKTGSGRQEMYNGKVADYPFVLTIDHMMTEVPISPAAIADDPALGGATTFDLQVEITYDDDWTSTNGTATIDGNFYQHPTFDSNIPQVDFWPVFPSLEFDSFFSAPDFGAPGFAGTPIITNNSMSAVWFDTPDTGNGVYTIARYTVTSGTTLAVSGTSTAASTQGTLHPFEFEVDVAGSDCPGDLNGDGERNQADLGLLLASYELDDGGDIDGDGDTDQADLGALLAVYEIPCP